MEKVPQIISVTDVDGHFVVLEFGVDLWHLVFVQACFDEEFFRRKHNGLLVGVFAGLAVLLLE